MNPNDLKYEDIQQQFIRSLNLDRDENKSKYFLELTNEREKWNFINEARNSLRTKTVIPSLKNVFGDYVTDQKKVANLLNYRFSKVGDFIEQCKFFKEETFDNSSIPNFAKISFHQITLYECKKIVRSLNRKKPLGPSNIPAWALKDSLNVIAEPLTFIINAFLEPGKFPNHLKRAHVVPIYKNGDAEEPNNYRPISITSALSKVFEKVICNQILEHLERNNLLCQIQFGFRAKYSTTNALLYATEKIRSDIDNNKMVAAAFLDLSKAFDSISHEILLEKLENLGFDQIAISLIGSYLSNRTQKVVIQNTSSDWIDIYQGVPQGTILGPLLFNLYVNSMQCAIQEPYELVQYADDTFLFVSNECLNTAVSQLETNAANLVDYFERHRSNLNKSKTEFIVFCKRSKNNSTKNLTFRVRNHLTKHSSFVKYLGIYLDQNLTYEYEVKNILKKMACGIKTLYSVKSFLPDKTCLMLLNSLVISHIHYPALLLNGISQNLITTLEKQLNWGVEAYFNRRKNDSSNDPKIKHNIFPIRILLDLKAVTYFWKYQNNLLPAFKSSNKITTALIKTQSRTKEISCGCQAKSAFMKNSFFMRIIPLWNSLPLMLFKEKYSIETIKSKLKRYFIDKIAHEIEHPEYRKKCWRDYRF